MSILEEVSEGKFHLLCSEISLKRSGSSAVSVRGPGLIEINAHGSFDYSFHISPKDYHFLYLNGLRADSI